jgi:1-acyl-sn-glycerol-3-phosphate acyltransferase/nucleoside-diphosphate-sugar epimerase
MARVMIIADNSPIAHDLVNGLSKGPSVDACLLAPWAGKGDAQMLAEQAIDTVVYVPKRCGKHEMAADLGEAAAVLQACGIAGMTHVILLSSAAIYGADPHHPGFVNESRLPVRRDHNPIGQAWIALEDLAHTHLGRQVNTTLTILRPAAVPVRGGTDLISRLFRHRWAFTLPLHDPVMQLLSSADLTAAVCCAVARRPDSTFNVAPNGVIPLRRALALADVRRLPLAFAPAGDELAYIQYPWTVSNAKIQRELGFVPQHSSADALFAMRHGQPSKGAPGANEQLAFDDFGMDEDYIKAWSRRLFRFLHDAYWRVEVKGIEHVPTHGAAVMAGMHRGFMPYDGVMMLHLLATRVNRYVRFLIHPALVKNPFPFNFGKLGGLSACRENADYVLQRGQLLGYFPEGIQGAFRSYRGVYQLGKFGRDEYVKAALRNQVPIVPFVTVGSAEIFPIIGKIKWPWWQAFSLWPCFPIAPPFPLLPVPLPTKWHTQFLEPIHIERDYGPDTANDAATVKAISQDVRKRMQGELNAMLKRRRSIFYGSLVTGENA